MQQNTNTEWLVLQTIHMYKENSSIFWKSCGIIKSGLKSRPGYIGAYKICILKIAYSSMRLHHPQCWL